MGTFRKCRCGCRIVTNFTYGLFIAFLVILIGLAVHPYAKSQEQLEANSDMKSKVGWIAYPYVFMSPETNLASGFGGIVYLRFSPDTTVKPSTITPSGYYSINDQYDITIIPEFYFGKKFYVYS